MIKKAAIVSAGVLLLLVLLFGSNLVPYAQTAWQKARSAVNDSISVEFKIDAAERELKNVDKEKRNMIYQIAKEKVAIQKLGEQIAKQEADLDRQLSHVMRLRDHLKSGETHYVSHNRRYTNGTVKENLANHWANYKIAKSTVEKTKEILMARESGLLAAENRLSEMEAERHRLQLEIEDLRARMHMLDVAKSANSIRYDDSHLSNAQEMILDAKTRLEVEAEIHALTPQYNGSIPMDGEEIGSDVDYLEEIDAYLDGESDNMAYNFE